MFTQYRYNTYTVIVDKSNDKIQYKRKWKYIVILGLCCDMLS